VGSERIPCSGLLIMGVLWVMEEDLTAAEARAEDIFGPLEFRSGNVPFGSFTSYYDEEMGRGIQRCLWAFKRPFKRGALVEAKLASNRVERDLARSGRRTVNLDPGLLTPESVVLATTKPYYHRIYIGKGVYGELTLFYRNGRFEVLPWTYPDYREEWAMDFLLKVRGAMLEERRGKAEAGIGNAESTAGR